MEETRSVKVKSGAEPKCQTVMCKADLTDKKVAAQWLLKHHPDKGGVPSPNGPDVDQVTKCFSKREFCAGTEDAPAAVPAPAVAQKSKKTVTVVNEKNSAAAEAAAQPPNLASAKAKPVTAPAAPAAAAPATAAPAAEAKAVTAPVSGTRKNNVTSSVGRIYERVKRKTAKSARGNAPENGQVVENPYKPNNRQLECLRQVSNFSKIMPSYRFDKSRFNPFELDTIIPYASPKLEALLQSINAFDNNDLAVDGVTHKHFIFSDVKTNGYGAKIIAAAFMARGYKSILKIEKGKMVIDVPESGKDKKNFAFVAREYVGLPDSMVASSAKSFGIQSENSKRRAMIAAGKRK
jgi:hypothetical protein